jgi:hypothetical protein
MITAYGSRSHRHHRDKIGRLSEQAGLVGRTGSTGSAAGGCVAQARTDRSWQESPEVPATQTTANATVDNDSRHQRSLPRSRPRPRLAVGRILDPTSKLAAARAMSSDTAASMRTSSTPRGTGCWSVSSPSRSRWPNAISPTARAAARSPSAAIAATAGRARSGSSTACSAPQMAARSPRDV